MIFAIEHLEDVLSEWLLLEYRHCVEITGGRLLFTNVRREEWRRKLEEIGGICLKESIVDLAEEFDRIAVLDPTGERRLEKGELEKYDVVVVGGILGDHPPRRRTRELLTRRLLEIKPECDVLNLGEKQLSIDGAILVALLINEGIEFELADEIEIELGEGHSIVLHYAVPVVSGKPIITPGLIEYLIRRAVE